MSRKDTDLSFSKPAARSITVTFIFPKTSVINETPQWKRLEEHAQTVKQTHLRNLMQDTERCFALMAEHKGILLDFSRENVLPETMVRGPSFYYSIIH